MGKSIDITNQKFGSLTALYKTDKKDSSGTYLWHCICDCGKECDVRGSALKSGHTKSCGCKKKIAAIQNTQKRIEDLTGKRFGKLVVLKRGENIGKHVAWICKCDCGNIKLINGDNLKYGGTKSCGCLQPEVASKTHFKDLTGQTFNKLKVLKIKGQTQDGRTLYECKCECGNICIVRGENLVNGHTKSCGCLKSETQSYGQTKITEILSNNNINFEQEKRFEDCKDKYTLPFDFYVDNKYVIEFDGRQHFESVEHFGGEEGLKIRQEHDKIKNEYCKNNNIPIIRIPYTHLNDLCLNDLQLETSSFIV